MSEMDCLNSLVKSLNRLLDKERAQLAAAESARDALEVSISRLREARDTLCECIHDVEPDDFRACGACWHNLDSAILALLASPTSGSSSAGEEEHDAEFEQMAAEQAAGGEARE